MACGGCGSKPVKHNPFDKRGNSLSKYAFLNPNQLAIKKAKELEEAENK